MSDDTRPTVARFEQMAVNLLDAYRTGTPDAMQRHWNDSWHSRAWPAMRRYVLLDLGRVPGVDDAYIDISLDDARLLVAREQAFDSWQGLVDFVASIPPGRTMIAARPVEVFSRAGSDKHEVFVTRDWEAALEMIAEKGSNSIHAHGQMTDAALERISRLQQVTSLQLAGSKALTDAGVLHLRRMPQLTDLDLSGTQLTDDGLAVLRDLPALRRVNLSGTRITDAGAAGLVHCDALNRLDLAWTRTGNGTIKALAGKTALSHIHTGVEVTDAGLRYLRELPVFKRWQGGEVVLELTAPDAEPNMLTLAGRFTDQGFEALRGLDGLFGLNIGDSRLGLTAAALAPLTSLPNLGKLSFDAHDDAMPWIAAMPKLRFLGVQDTDASDDGWVALSRSNSIEGIWGRRCHNLRSRGFRALGTMPSLRQLSVSCLNVDDDALAMLPTFPSLRNIMPMDVPDAGYRHIGACRDLEQLTLMYCRETTDEATTHITGLRNLRNYFASFTQVTDRTPELLSEIESLEKVEFSGCAALTNAAATALARLPRLREVTLDGPHHVTRDAAALFAAGVRVKISG